MGAGNSNNSASVEKMTLLHKFAYQTINNGRGVRGSSDEMSAEPDKMSNLSQNKLKELSPMRGKNNYESDIG